MVRGVRVTEPPEPMHDVEGQLTPPDSLLPHAGQHVLSAVAEILLGAKTSSWELHPTSWEDLDCVCVDLEVGSLSAEQVGQGWQQHGHAPAG